MRSAVPVPGASELHASSASLTAWQSAWPAFRLPREGFSRHLRRMQGQEGSAGMPGRLQRRLHTGCW